MSPAEIAAIEHFRARLHEQVRADQIRSLILYGSKARGDAHPHSDVDLLLVLDQVTPEEKERLDEMTADVKFDCMETDLQILVRTVQQVTDAASYGTFLYQNIERDGIVLEGGPVEVKKIDKPKLVKQELDLALESLKEAELLFNHALWRGAVSKTYFVYMHTARTLLAAKGVTPQSHAGTNNLFSLHFVKPKILDKKYSTLLQNMEKSRLDADYEPKVVFQREDAERALARAREFLAVAQNLLPSLMADET